MSLALLGAGAMGEALLAGWIAAGTAPEELVIVDAAPGRVEELEQRYGVSGVGAAEAAGADIVVLAVKPYQVPTLLEQLTPTLKPSSLVISIAAGVSMAALTEALPDGQPAIRVMPNTPALVGQGMAGIVVGPHAGDEHRETAVDLMNAVGKAVVIEEKQMDALTALSGSGPAYLFYVAEAMIEAGVHQGLPRAEATALVNQTFVGAAAMLDGSGESATVLRERVTSPAGTTAAALRALDDHGVRSGFLAAAEACVRRSREMTQHSS